MIIEKYYFKISDFLKELADKSSPRWGVLLIDIFLVLNAFLISYLIRFNFGFKFERFELLPQLVLVSFFALVSFLLTGSYRGIVRHTGLNDAVNVAKSGIIMTVFLFFSVFLVRKFHFLTAINIPLSVIGINFFVATFLLISSRIVYKAFHQKLVSHVERKNIIIHGAHTGKAVFDAILASQDTPYRVVAFVDERSRYLNKSIHGINVFHPDRITSDFFKKHNIKEVIISKPEAKSLELLTIANKYLDLGLKVKTVPYINQWIDKEQINVSQIKELNIEELLNRNPIKIDNPDIQKDLQGKVVMVTGAAGSIGSEIARQVMHFTPGLVVLIDQAESPLYDLQQEFIAKSFKNFKAIVTDVRDAHKMRGYFEKYRPDVVYHAAAYKHVPLMEENPYEAVKVNVLGSQILMDLAVAYKVGKFVMVSTDKAVNPTNVMGATKRAAEIYATCLQRNTADTKFIITRFGNVLGSNGSVIQLFKKQMQKGGPLTVTHKEITRFFMTIPEACHLVLEAGTMGKGGEIFVFDMGEPVRIFDLAVKMIQLSGYKYPEEISIKITGLRPGEKLYEEVLGQNEGDLPTHHKKIKIARLEQPDCEKILKYFKILKDYKKMTNFEIVKILKEMIPEFVSNNSVYQKLDFELKKLSKNYGKSKVI